MKKRWAECMTPTTHTPPSGQLQRNPKFKKPAFEANAAGVMTISTTIITRHVA